MISNSIREWNVQQNRYPSVFLVQNTPTGIFSISDVEAEVNNKLEPLERMALELCNSFEKITRIELHAISGLSIGICDEELTELQKHGLVDIVEFDKAALQENVEKLHVQLGEDWLTPHIKFILHQTVLRQYMLSETGQKALETGNKRVIENRDLKIIMTGKPYYLYYDEFELRSDGYEYITMNRSLVHHVLATAEQFNKISGIKPISISSNSVVDGKEVSNTQFWVTIFANGKKDLKKAKYQSYLSSRSFERWSNPPWDKKLMETLPEEETLQRLVISAMSETYSMVEDVIEEGLTLLDNRVTWRLEADLEMLLLIYKVSKQPIAETYAEVKLKHPRSDWGVVVLVQLEPYDDLAGTALRSGRFHERAPRKGFTLEEGFRLWNKIMEDWGKELSREHYLETIEELVKYDCLVERIPEINELVVDLDDLLGFERRGKQSWEFQRIRQLVAICEQAEVKAEMMASNAILSRIDDTASLDQWIGDGQITVLDSGDETPLDIARKKKIHYLGIKTYKTKSEDKTYSRTLKYYINRKRIIIPNLEPFYDWRMNDLFQQMYDVYYE